MASARQDMAAVAEGLREALRGVPPARVAVLCIGNPDRGDDGFGPAVAALLGGDLACPVLNCGMTPENDLPKVAEAQPGVVLMVDAVHLDAEVGAVGLLRPDELAGGGLSTHAASLSVAAEYLRQSCGARVLVLGTQPGNVSMQARMSPDMAAGAEAVASLLRRLLGAAGSGEK